MKKKTNDAGGLVYSTNPDAQTASDTDVSATTLPPAKQDLRITLDKKLKAGKVATVVYNYVGPEADLEALAKLLKTHCGVGGTSKKGEIILQGNCLEKVQVKLKQLGYKFKLAGV